MEILRVDIDSRANLGTKEEFMKRLTLLLLILTLCLLTLNSEENEQSETVELGSISINVVDIENNPIAYANIVLFKDGKSSQLGGQTNKNGNCKIINIPLGVYDIKVTKMSYAAETIENLRINAGENSTQNVTLNKQLI